MSDERPAFRPTTAASSGVRLDRKELKALVARSDRPGLVWLAQWITALALTGYGVHLSLGGWLIVPAMIVFGSVLTVPAYALSHETAHGSAFRTRALNEALLWLSSLIYGEEPYHRRYAHTSHHTHTWHVGLDGQMPFDLPMTFGGWLLEVSGVALIWYEVKLFVMLGLGRFSREVRRYTPESELGKLAWSARGCLAVYGALAAVVASGYMWPLVYFFIPRLVGGVTMQLFTVLQHAELAENAPDLRQSTRSFRAGPIGRFLYMNMNHHIEHHLYPQAPFHALPRLADRLKDQLPPPDAGVLACSFDLARVVARRSLGLEARSRVLRQAAHMVTTGRPQRLARATMR